MTRSQRILLVVAGIIAAIIFAVLTIYYATAASGHPRAKHMILFIVLAVISLLISWFSLPEGTLQRSRRL